MVRDFSRRFEENLNQGRRNGQKKRRYQGQSELVQKPTVPDFYQTTHNGQNYPEKSRRQKIQRMENRYGRLPIRSRRGKNQRKINEKRQKKGRRPKPKTTSPTNQWIPSGPSGQRLRTKTPDSATLKIQGINLRERVSISPLFQVEPNGRPIQHRTFIWLGRAYLQLQADSLFEQSNWNDEAGRTKKPSCDWEMGKGHFGRRVSLEWKGQRSCSGRILLWFQRTWSMNPKFLITFK